MTGKKRARKEGASQTTAEVGTGGATGAAAKRAATCEAKRARANGAAASALTSDDSDEEPFDVGRCPWRMMLDVSVA